MIKAVIFDLDGTLLNTLEDITDSVNAAMRQFELPEVSLEKVRSSVGNGGRVLISKVVPEGEANPRFEEILGYYVPYYEGHCRIKTRPYDGILEMMGVLRDMGLKMAIVSNKGDGAVKELAAIYFQELVAEAVGEREGIRRKPWPDSVLEAMRLLACGPDEVLYVGDSEVDHETAQAAGIPDVLVTWGFRPAQDLAKLGSAYLIDRPEELADIIRRSHQVAIRQGKKECGRKAAAGREFREG